MEVLTKIINSISRNPVRMYTIAVSMMPLIAFYFANFPGELVVPVMAAVFGLGENVRGVVTPVKDPKVTKVVTLKPEDSNV